MAMITSLARRWTVVRIPRCYTGSLPPPSDGFGAYLPSTKQRYMVPFLGDRVPLLVRSARGDVQALVQRFELLCSRVETVVVVPALAMFATVFARDRGIGASQLFLQEVQRKGLLPEELFYGGAVRAFAELNDGIRLQKFHEEAKQKGIEIPADHLAAAEATLAQKGRFKYSEALRGQLHDRSALQPMSIANYVCSKQDFHGTTEAMKALAQAEKKDLIRPSDTLAYKMILSKLIFGAEPQVGAELLRRLESNGFVPDRTALLMLASCKDEDVLDRVGWHLQNRFPELKFPWRRMAAAYRMLGNFDAAKDADALSEAGEDDPIDGGMLRIDRQQAVQKLERMSKYSMLAAELVKRRADPIDTVVVDLLREACARKQFETGLQVIREAKAIDAKTNSAYFAFKAEIYAQLGKTSKIGEVFAEGQRSTRNPFKKASILKRILLAVAKSRDVEQLKKLLQSTPTEVLASDSNLLRSVATCLGTHIELDECYELLRRLREHKAQGNIVTTEDIEIVYSGILIACSVKKDSLALEGVRREMEGLNIAPTTLSYSNWLKNSILAGDLDTARVVYEEGLAAPGRKDMVYIEAASYFARTGDFSSIRRCFDKCPFKDSKARALYIGNAMDLLLNKQVDGGTKVNMVRWCRQQLVDFNLPSHTRYYKTMFKYFLAKKNGKSALDLYNVYRREETLIPDKYIFALVLFSCLAARDVARIEQILADMQYHKIPVNQVHCEGLVKLFAKTGRLQQAFKYFEKIVQWQQPSEEAVSAMVRVITECGDLRFAPNLYESLSTLEKYQSSRVMESQLIAFEGRRENPRRARKFFDVVPIGSVTPSMVAALAYAYAKAEYSTDLKKHFAIFHAKPEMFDEDTISTILEELANGGNETAGFEFLEFAEQYRRVSFASKAKAIAVLCDRELYEVALEGVKKYINPKERKKVPNLGAVYRGLLQRFAGETRLQVTHLFHQWYPRSSPIFKDVEQELGAISVDTDDPSGDESLDRFEHQLLEQALKI